MQGAAERQVTSIGQRRDDQSTIVPQVFVAVLKLGVDHADFQVVSYPVVSAPL